MPSSTSSWRKEASEEFVMFLRVRQTLPIMHLAIVMARNVAFDIAALLQTTRFSQ